MTTETGKKGSAIEYTVKSQKDILNRLYTFLLKKLCFRYVKLNCAKLKLSENAFHPDPNTSKVPIYYYIF